MLAVVLTFGADALGQTSSEAPAPPPEVVAAAKLFDAQDWPAAIKAYEALTNADGKFALGWLRLGYAHHAMKQFDEAIVAYRKGAAFPNVRRVCLYNTACALALKGEKDSAFTELDAAIDAGFQDNAHMAEDDDLKSLRDDARFAKALRRATPIAELAREFHFWVGEWDVYMNETQVGTNRIELEEGGCLITEHWSNMKGNTGQSINYIDPVTRTWKQVWVDPSGSVVMYDGQVRDGAMHFTGSSIPAFGPKQTARGSLTPQADGTVLHVIEHSADNCATWTPYFHGVYRRKSNEATDTDSR